ncbi:MAG: iron ABC transporter permease [Clostridia bacterium]|jgi:iron complex transport system permease protein|nr:iron ABC transporter permease [Clostridia bacterium]MDH7573780.1 iron ABC transporter permease [Clostridia bacterium]
MKKGWRTGLVVALIGSIVVAMNSGRYAVSPAGVLSILAHGVGLGGLVSPPTPEMEMVFWNIRVPRILVAFTVGSALSVSGAVLQALFRNPLASPDIVGVTQGAGFGAALALMFFPPLSAVVQGSAFLFGILAVSIAYLLASRSPDRSVAVLVITGIVVSAVFQAGLSLLQYFADPYDQLAKIVFWIMGSFQTASWGNVRTVVPLVAAGTLLLVVFGWRLNVMAQDDEQALSLGINVPAWRLLYVFLATLIVASSVSATGNISWVGLIVPHIGRYLVGSEHRRLVATSALIGGIFLVLMDTAARSLMPGEIPISIVTSMVGAPFLASLVLSRGGVLKREHTSG